MLRQQVSLNCRFAEPEAEGGDAEAAGALDAACAAFSLSEQGGARPEAEGRDAEAAGALGAACAAFLLAEHNEYMPAQSGPISRGMEEAGMLRQQVS